MVLTPNQISCIQNILRTTVITTDIQLVQHQIQHECDITAQFELYYRHNLLHFKDINTTDTIDIHGFHKNEIQPSSRPLFLPHHPMDFHFSKM